MQSYGYYGYSSIALKCDALAHYGIPGQQWGKRRFQNEDGSYTEEGKRRYGIIGSDGKLRPSQNLVADYQQKKARDSQYLREIQQEKKQNRPISKRRQQLTEDYKSKGLTQEQAEVAALKRERTETLLKVAGAIAVTAAVAYGAYKGRQWLSRNADYKIKAGKDLFRTTQYANEDLNRAGYVANNTRDADKYVGAYGNQIHQNKAIQRLDSIFQGKKLNPVVADDNIYQVRGKAAGNIRVAGDRKANKVYKQLLANDKEFAADNEIVKKRWADMGSNGGDAYKDFNTRLVDHQDEAANRVQQKFYDALKAKGYGGVIDVNDRDFSGYNAKKPVILFNMKDSIKDVSVRSIDKYEVANKYGKAYALMNKEATNKVLVSEAAKSVRDIAGWGAVGSGLGLLGVKSNDREALRRGAYQKSIVQQYKKEHPGTKLSDTQILENELGYDPRKRA